MVKFHGKQVARVHWKTRFRKFLKWSYRATLWYMASVVILDSLVNHLLRPVIAEEEVVNR